MYIACSDFNNNINKKYVDKTSSLLSEVCCVLSDIKSLHVIYSLLFLTDMYVNVWTPKGHAFCGMFLKLFKKVAACVLLGLQHLA